jgi:hypothetical protein
MREIRSGDTVLRIRASSLAIFFYKQEFKADILRDFSRICKGWVESDVIKKHKAGELNTADMTEVFNILPDGNDLLQIVWALNKAQNVSEKLPTPHFAEWVEKHDLSILEILPDVISECMHGFFRAQPPL